MNKLRIRKIGILSVAKIYAVMMLVVSLIISIPYGLVIMIFGAAMLGQGSDAGMAAGGGSILIGLLVMIGIPIMYAVFGFIGGAIGALIYNIFAGMVGGVEIEVENVY
ncbi:MAG TPA: hypothetical protein PKE69_02120 [Pyrinomonadaceae bacterium]|nr:hypothetical protein [Pyrinomonadaceae bacterium]